MRPRRNRRTEAIRALVEEHHLRPADLVIPFFVIEGERKKENILSMPGVYRLTLDLLVEEAIGYHRRGIRAIALFPVIDRLLKDEEGSQSVDPEGLIPRAIRRLKREVPSLCVIADIALDPFTSHGHDGRVNEKGEVLNDATVEVLCEMAKMYAEAGVDMVAPSDMMDGRIGRIRECLDGARFEGVGILAYTAKYASSLYAPFREALGSGLTFGDKKTYQMNPANCREAVRQARLDVEQGADMVMVKPALYYLDVIATLRKEVVVPVCAFHVSGEYAMVMAAALQGWLDAPSVFYEALISLKRAGADFIFTYAIEQVLPMLEVNSL